MLVIHDSALSSSTAAVLAEDSASPILSIAAQPTQVLPVQLQQVVDDTIRFRASVKSVFESVDCASSAFLEYYARSKGVPFGKIVAQEALGLLGHIDQAIGATFGPNTGLVELSKPLSAELSREGTPRLVVTMGNSSIPIDTILPDILLRFPKVKEVEVLRFVDERLGQMRVVVPIHRKVTAAPTPFDPMATLVLVSCFLAREKLQGGVSSLGVNINRLVVWAFETGVARLVPAERGSARARAGLSKALRKIARRLVAEGLLSVYEKRRGPRWEFFSLTNLGYSYAQVLLQLSQHIEPESAALVVPEIVDVINTGVAEYAGQV